MTVNYFFTYFNLICKLAAMVFLLLALYRSENIFIKARNRDVREILTPDIIRYETNVRIKLIGKFILSVLLLFVSFSRILSGYLFISIIDLGVWVAISIVFLIICYIDFKFSSPENEPDKN